MNNTPGTRGAVTRAPISFTTQRAAFGALFVLLVAASWSALWLWSASPYARYLEHPGWADAAGFAAFCRAVAVPAAVHAAAWVLMIAAMMLPTTYPLLAMFHRVTAGRADGGRLVARVVLGFLLVWLAFGVVAYGIDAGVRAVASKSDWMLLYGWAVGAVALAGAGLFQFSALKYRCLEQCQAPFSFVAARWHGARPGAEALRIGIDHGIFCVGCCWALMLVMFVVGMGNLGWMLLLATVMAAEKNLPLGRSIAAPTGFALLGGAALLAAGALYG
jgi:predicted metal-binding membrane protein